MEFIFIFFKKLILFFIKYFQILPSLIIKNLLKFAEWIFLTNLPSMLWLVSVIIGFY